LYTQKRRLKGRRLVSGFESESGFRSPNRTPPGSGNSFARENLARAPGFTISTLNQCAIGASLVGRRIGSCTRINSRRIVRVFHCLRHRIVFRNLWQVCSLCITAGLGEATNSGYG